MHAHDDLLCRSATILEFPQDSSDHFGCPIMNRQVIKGDRIFLLPEKIVNRRYGQTLAREQEKLISKYGFRPLTLIDTVRRDGKKLLCLDVGDGETIEITEQQAA